MHSVATLPLEAVGCSPFKGTLQRCEGPGKKLHFFISLLFASFNISTFSHWVQSLAMFDMSWFFLAMMTSTMSEWPEAIMDAIDLAFPVTIRSQHKRSLAIHFWINSGVRLKMWAATGEEKQCFDQNPVKRSRNAKSEAYSIFVCFQFADSSCE